MSTARVAGKAVVNQLGRVVMSVESEQNRPNEFGFAGAATAPEPAKDAEPVAPEEADGESAAVPSDDITGSITEAMQQSTEHSDDDEESGAG